VAALDFEHVPGRLCADPTDLSTGSYPWGGTALGIVRDCRLRVRRREREIHAEEHAMTGQVLRGAEAYYFLAVMRRMDTRMLLRLFPGSAAGATAGRALVDPDLSSDDERAGNISTAFSLYFSPDSDQHLGVLFYRAVPVLGLLGDAEAELLVNRDVGFPVAFVATPSASNSKAVAIGCREDLTL
jgi:hypothetical protein